MNNLPDEFLEDIELVIEMLADNELSIDDRKKVFDRFDKDPALWKKCAITFLDRQFLSESFFEFRGKASSPLHSCSTIPSDKSKTDYRRFPIENTSRNQHTANRTPLSKIAFVAMTLIIACLGWLCIYQTLEKPGQAAHRNDPHSNQDINLSQQSVSLASVQSLLSSIDQTNRRNEEHNSLPKFYEIKNNDREAIYYVDRASADFLVESMVLAGHTVDIESEPIEFSTVDGNRCQIPLLVVRISKSNRMNTL